MSLHELWLTAPQQLREKHVQQIIAFAGEGKLLDGATASHEFRRLLASVPSQILRRYADECLAEAFPNCGLALQDIVNEVGRRLGFAVTPGRYRGVSGQIGFDGIWLFPVGHGVVIEVKKTLAYRIDLKTVIQSRRELINDRGLAEDRSSILLIVGPQDTEDLEAQIRGSRQAWDIRVIAIERGLRCTDSKCATRPPSCASSVQRWRRPTGPWQLYALFRKSTIGLARQTIGSHFIRTKRRLSNRHRLPTWHSAVGRPTACF